MRNPKEKFRQSSIIFEKPGLLFEKLKILTSPATIEFNISCWNFAHVSYLPMSKKGCSGLILFWVICKNRKRPGFSKLVFYTLLITQDLSKIKKKSRTGFCRHC